MKFKKKINRKKRDFIERKMIEIKKKMIVNVNMLSSKNRNERNCMKKLCKKKSINER